LDTRLVSKLGLGYEELIALGLGYEELIELELG